MPQSCVIVILLLVLLFILALFYTLSQSTSKNLLENPDNSDFQTAVDAYIYGYPLVLMYYTMKEQLKDTPLGQFEHLRTFPDASFRQVVAPNVDTLYSSAWVDLSSGGYILHVPDTTDHFFVLQIMDMWTDDLENVPGTRVYGSKAKDFLLIGPDYKGKIPGNMTVLRSPTNLIWIIGRTHWNGTARDLDKIHDIQNGYSLKPAPGNTALSQKVSNGKDIDVKYTTNVRDQVDALTGPEYFRLLDELLKKTPPAADAEIIRRMTQLGLYPEYNPSLDDLVSQVPAAAIQKMKTYKYPNAHNENGWIVNPDYGKFGTDYLFRATSAYNLLGANLAVDALYPHTYVDSQGNALNGKNTYRITFPVKELPPVHGFWSLTVYNDQNFLADNPMNRYSLSPRDNLIYNPDESLDIYISHDKHDGNWLPAPLGNFYLTLRLYWPDTSILNGLWQIPPVTKVN